LQILVQKSIRDGTIVYLFADLALVYPLILAGRGIPHGAVELLRTVVGREHQRVRLVASALDVERGVVYGAASRDVGVIVVDGVLHFQKFELLHI
jgi:hypothetical protein